MVLAEHAQGALKKTTLELMSKGRELADALKCPLQVVLIGDSCRNLIDTLVKHGADNIILVEGKEFRSFNPHLYSTVFRKIIEDKKPQIIMFSHQFMNFDLAPCLASNLNATYVSNCRTVEIRDGKLILYRSMYGGKIVAEVTYEQSTPLIISVKSGVAKEREVKGDGVVTELKIEPFEVAEKVIAVFEEAVGEDITKADIVVAFGRGIGNKENIELIRSLANELGAALACTRPIVDLGWLGKQHLVGISGKVVSPKVYLALGISGQSQHVEGINAETIIAVNKDPSAPILEVADYAIVGDLFNVVPILTEYIRRHKRRS
jgi:electron transfer flavoprotein alpha subunit